MTTPIASDLLPPACVLRVGITGHRANRLPDDVTALRAALAQVMRALAADAKALLAEGGAGSYRDDPDAPHFRLTGGLAPGADRLAMLAARDLGWDTQVVLPREREAFLAEQRSACSTRAEDSDAQFEALLTSATAVLTLDGDGEGHRRNAHELAARVIVQQSDVLIAVWDGAPGAGMGGTAHVVREALAQGAAVIWLDPQGVLPARYLLPGQPDPVPHPSFGAWLRAVLLLPEQACAPAAHHNHADGALLRWQRALRERARASRFPPLYQCLLCLSGKRLPAWRLRFEDSVGNWQKNWSDYADKLGPDPHRDAAYARLQQRFHFFDHLAEIYGRSYRASYLLIYVIAFLATCAGLAGVFSDMATKAWLVLLELGLIGTMVAVALTGKRRQWHERWLDYRAVAEQLRHARLGLWTGQSFQPAATERCEGAAAAWTSWYLRACVRELPMPTRRIDAEYCRNAIAAVMQFEIRNQREFNARTAETQHRMHMHFERAEVVLLIVLVLFAALFLGIVVIARPYWLHLHHDTQDHIKHAMSYCGIIIPALGAVLLGIRAQSDFHAYSERAAETATHLTAVEERIGRMLARTDTSSPRFEDLLDIADASIAALSTDVHAWRSVYRRKALSVAA